MSPTRYRFSTPHWNKIGKPGFEPGQTESKSGVLPLDDFPFTKFKLLKKGLEPSSRKAYAPQAYMYTSSITSAFLWMLFLYTDYETKINYIFIFFIVFHFSVKISQIFAFSFPFEYTYSELFLFLKYNNEKKSDHILVYSPSRRTYLF